MPMSTGELDPERRAAVDRYLAEHPRGGRARRGLAPAERGARRALWPHRRSEPVPPRLDVHRIAGALAASGWRRGPGTALRRPRFFSLPSVSPAAGSVGATGRLDAWANTLVAEAVAAHNLYTREVVHPVEVGADQQTDLTAWLSKRLGRNLVVPDFRPLGFSLVGGRLLPVAGPTCRAAHVRGRDRPAGDLSDRGRKRWSGVVLAVRPDGRPEIVPLDRRDDPMCARRQPGTRSASRHRYARIRATRLSLPYAGASDWALAPILRLPARRRCRRRRQPGDRRACR